MLDELKVIKTNQEYFDRISLEIYRRMMKEFLEKERLDKSRILCNNIILNINIISE